LQAGYIENADAAPAVADQAGRLQCSGSRGNTHPAHAQQASDRALIQKSLTGVGVVIHREQATSKTLLDVMVWLHATDWLMTARNVRA
jgi:hypothetical protein